MRTLRLWPVLAGMLVGLWWADASAQTANGTVTLQWTAPGDDSLTGTATRYDLRYSLFPITETNFAFCSGPAGIPRPTPSGTMQRYTVDGLLPGLRYYFALKTADERLNWSPLSNVVAIAEPVSVQNPGPAKIEFGIPYPNPCRTTATFRYALAEPAHIEVDIHDVMGRFVHRLVNERWPAGSGTMVWNLDDHLGQRVPVGAYLVRAKIGDTELRRRVVVTH